jgi:hypothetical protein
VDYHFPSIPNDIAGQFGLMLMIAKDKPDYFDAPNCPYPDELKALLKELTAPKPVLPPLMTVDDKPMVGEDKWVTLEREAKKVFDDLKASYPDIQVQDVAERMSFFRTAASLLEKLVGLQERAVGLKQMSEFQNTIIQFLDEICDNNQKTILMERMKSLQLSEGASRVSQEDKPVVKAKPASQDRGGEPDGL